MPPKGQVILVLSIEVKYVASQALLLLDVRGLPVWLKLEAPILANGKGLEAYEF